MKKIAILLIVVLVISVGFLSGCNEQEASNINNENDNLNDEEKEEEEPEIEYDDVEFAIWCLDCIQTMKQFNRDEAKAIDNEQWNNLKNTMNLKMDFIKNTAKPECLKFYLSTEYDKARDEYYEYLEDAWWTAYYMKRFSSYEIEGLWDLANENLELAIEYIEKSNLHLEEHNRISEGLKFFEDV